MNYPRHNQQNNKFWAILASCFFVLITSLPSHTLAARKSSEDIVIDKTMVSFSKIPGLSKRNLKEGRKIFQNMSYNSQRITRQISLLPGANFSMCKQIWEELENGRTSYRHILAFEEWAKLRGATMPLAVHAFSDIKNLNRDTLKPFRAFLAIKELRADTALLVIPKINSMESANNLAARKMFAVQEINVQEAFDNLDILSTYTSKQAWAYAIFVETEGMGAETVTDALPLFKQLRDEDAWNMRALIKQKKMSREAAWTWLVRYFAQPMLVQEKQFYQYDEQERTNLLEAFYGAGEELIWRINSLHAVSDEYGTEISSAELRKMSGDELQALFDKLSYKTKVNYGSHFVAASEADKKSQMITLLRKATTTDRTQVSKDLSTANIYALLAQGSELYDSSFRNILVPILKNRMQQAHRNNLLTFLKKTDPDNLLVSSFIVSLAQKGKLTAFFPKDGGEQKKILELVAQSAFKDEDSILLFSATFRHLLQVLEPGARHFLINKMVQADNGKGGFSKLITVILQYYLQEYPDLLNTESRQLIKETISRNGTVDLSKYLVTPFAQWKKDKRLGSISVFHPDDDGRKSFISNARSLGRHGYKIELSEQYTPLQNASMRKISERAIKRAQKQSREDLAALFDAMLGNPFSVAFVKTVKDINIRHSVYVYANELDQQQLILRFLQSDDEMLAQRGHSYWRAEQITHPLEKLKESKAISDQDLISKQRFLSLGSCGGVKAYTKLSRMFLGHIDILATIGTGMAIINDPYNRNFFEIIAENPSSITWENMADESSFIFANGRGQDYLQPGCLTAILHKILDEEALKNGFFPAEAAEPDDN